METSPRRQTGTSPGRQLRTSRNGQIGSLGDVLGTLEGHVLGTSWEPIFAGWVAAAEKLTLKFASIEHLLNYHKEHPDQNENIHKLCDQMGQSFFSLNESQWKMRQQHNQNFPKEGKPL